ncbi:MAG TPA: MMPL family transporter [Candidatus Thermoplasmatota archaeon]|nr:MMPL family transporter [Candidatus Thermoplasmatota archaeon]
MAKAERAGAIERAFQNTLSALVRGSAHKAWLVVAIVALLTAGSVAVLVTVEPNVETDIQTGYFATYDDQANAFRELRARVAGVNSEIVYFELKEGAEGLNPFSGEVEPVDNVTDVPALLAQEELFAFVKAEFAKRAGVDKVLSHTSLPYFYKLIYKQFPQGGYEVPTNPVDHAVVSQLVLSAGGPSINLYHSKNATAAPEAAWDAAVMFIIYDPDTSVLSKKETGGLINEIIEDYRGMEVGECGASGACKTYDLWDPAYFDSWGVQSWIYRIDEQVREEALIFTGAIFLVIAVSLTLLLRNVKRALIGVVTLAIILLWTLAGMTLGGVSVGFISMAMFPLILGVGADYVIHIMNEFAQERSSARTSVEAFDHVGRRGAMALWIATITTLAGFVVILFSTSPMIVQICWATLGGITGIYLLSITFVPAMLQLTLPNETREVSRPSEAMGRLGAFLGRHKVWAAAVLVAGTVFFALQIPQVEYVIGTVEVNLPQKELWTHGEDRAHMLDMYERFQDHIHATGQETVITEGDGPGSLATKAAVNDMIAIHRAMVADPFVQDAGGAVNSVPFILNLYAILREGIQTAGPAVGQDVLLGGILLPCPAAPGAPPQLCYPGLDPAYDPTFAHIEDWDDADVRAAYDDMLEREEWRPLLLTFMDRDASIAWALTFVNIPIDQEATHKADAAFRAVVDASPDAASESHYFGTLTGIKKYNDYTNHWLKLSNAVSIVVVLALVLLFTRSGRTVAAVSLPLGLTFVWWLGILPVLDIDLAFVYLIPTSFITSIGSDYAVHLAYNMHLGTSPRDVFRTVGKGVAFSSTTALLSFLIFSRGAIRGSYEMFVACVAAIVIITVTTFLAVPLFYRWDEEPVAFRRVPGKRGPQP